MDHFHTPHTKRDLDPENRKKCQFDSTNVDYIVLPLIQYYPHTILQSCLNVSDMSNQLNVFVKLRD